MYQKNHLAILIVFLFSLHTYAQKGFIAFEQVSVQNIAAIENSFNATVFESKFEHVESKKDSTIRYGKLNRYCRPENKHFGKVNVTYYFLPSDNFARKITYSWNCPKNSTLKEYSKQFDKTVKAISTELDLPMGEQGKLVKVMDEPVAGIPVEVTQRKMSWEHKGAKIVVIMIWSEKHGASLNTEIDWRK